MLWAALCRKRGVSESACCIRSWDATRAKHYKSKGLAVLVRVRAVVFEAHCEVRRANFSDFSKNPRKCLGKKRFFREISRKWFCASRIETGKYGKT